MRYLADTILNRESSRLLWHASGGQAVTVGEMRKALLSMDVVEWSNRRIALAQMSTVELCRALVLLDGVAASIFLLPLELEATVQSALLEKLEIEATIGAGGVPLEAVAGALHVSPTEGTSLPARGAIETQWILPTSGTTGVPKLVRHSLATLTREMPSRDLGGEFVWGSLYGPRRFAGLQVFLQAVLAGTQLILSDREETSQEYVRRLTDLGCNALSATPSMWRKLAMCPGFELLPLKQITLGGEIADQQILGMLRSCFPEARVTHIYASTEAGVGFVVNDCRAGFPASFLDVPPRGVAMRIDASGRLWLRPGGVSGATSVTSSTVSSEWLDSGDVVRREGDRVYFLGRASGSINVGGNKVMPEEVEAVIQEVQGVAFAVAKGRKNSLMGNLVEAQVMTEEGVIFDDELKHRIAAHCRKRLEAYKVPVFIGPIDNIELTSTGKIDRQVSA